MDKFIVSSQYIDATISLSSNTTGNIEGTTTNISEYYQHWFETSDRITKYNPFASTDVYNFTEDVGSNYQVYFLIVSDFTETDRTIHFSSANMSDRYIQFNSASFNFPTSTTITTAYHFYNTDINNPYHIYYTTDALASSDADNIYFFAIDTLNHSIVNQSGAGGVNLNVLDYVSNVPGVIDEILNGIIYVKEDSGVGSLNISEGYLNLSATKYPDIPRFNYTSAGTQILISSDHSSTSVDYAIGLASDTVWHSIPTASDQFSWYAGENEIGKLDGNGNMYLNGDLTAFYSDQRLKKIVAPIDDALNKLCSLNTFEYVPNDLAKSFGFNDKNNLGVSAQEVKELFPQIVGLAPFDMDEIGNSKSGDNYLTLQYARLVPVIIEALKEVKNNSDAQEKIINENINEIARLKKIIFNLTKI
jgi:hypothetical protein